MKLSLSRTKTGATASRLCRICACVVNLRSSEHGDVSATDTARSSRGDERRGSSRCSVRRNASKNAATKSIRVVIRAGLCRASVDGRRSEGFMERSRTASVRRRPLRRRARAFARPGDQSLHGCAAANEGRSIGPRGISRVPAFFPAERARSRAGGKTARSSRSGPSRGERATPRRLCLPAFVSPAAPTDGRKPAPGTPRRGGGGAQPT